ncbi:CDP-glycerol glycerophosphotransferase family protein [Mammaliicoccus fleurettii]|uniref:CDP-glycerol glycerophosphotransferase family protein n=1 Tax=Mammaliicoccus fleurettii TaxID=150056 RepID=UPI002DBF597D|nr:CDP-glycerol glycerophosphotransferase family protein [Mammaliicoccus fleurettii]MEB7781074.1 CDP-glycerol glycerophosphotransferase family protein [Mammaliicoccus fleurettii]
MNKYNIKIDNIYWERIQLYIEGHVNGLEIEKGNFFLKDIYSKKKLKPNEIHVNNSFFKLRFNIAILDNGNFLPSGLFKIVFKDNSDYIASLNSKLLDPLTYDMNEQEKRMYSLINKENEKNNYLLNKFSHTFLKNDALRDIEYKVTPKVSRKKQELILKVEFSYPNPTLKLIREKLKNFKKPIKSISYELRNLIFKFIFITSKYLYIRKEKTVLFTSDSRGDRTGNFKYIYNEMTKHGLDKIYDINEIYKSNISIRRNLKDKFKFPYLLGKADYIFVDDYHPLLYNLKFRKNQEIIQLWHAVGSFKTVGYSRTGKKEGPFFNSVNHRNYTKVYVSSEIDIPYYGEAFGILEENIVPKGIPRTDMFFDSKYKKNKIQEVQNEFPKIKNKNVILFAPTFRGSGHFTAYYPYEMFDFDCLAKYCFDENAIILFKMHPFIKSKMNIPEKYKEYFIDISNYREVNDFLLITDILISDYSSLIYEFAIFEKPMLFYAFDLDEYTLNRGFYEPYMDFVPGKIVKSFDELIRSLYNNDFEQEKVTKFLNKHFKYLDGKSSERIIRDIFSETFK